MKKLFLLLNVLFWYSCSEVPNPNLSSNEKFYSILKVNQSTDLVSRLFQKFEVSEIIVNEIEGGRQFQFQSNSIVQIEDKKFQLSKIKFSAFENKFYIDGMVDEYFVLENGFPFFYSENQKFKIFEIPENLRTPVIQLLTLAFSELTEDFENKRMSNSKKEKSRIMCGGSMMYLTSVNLSSSVAVAELQGAIDSGQYNVGCSKVGGIDVSCLLTSHVCVATQAYCCPS